MDFIKGNEQVRIDPSGIDISGAGHITIDSEKISGNLAIDGELNMVGDLSMNGGLEVYNGKVGIGKTPGTLYNLDIIGAINCTDGVFVNNSSLTAGTGEPIVAKGMVVQIKHTDYNKKVRKNTGGLGSGTRGWRAIDPRETLDENGNIEGFIVKIKPTSIKSKVMINTVVHIGGNWTNHTDAFYWGVRLYRKVGNGDWQEVVGANGGDSSTVIIHQGNGVYGTETDGLEHNTNKVWFSNSQGADNNSYINNTTASYLDSPGTTEEVMYTMWWNSVLDNDMNGYGDLTLNRPHDRGGGSTTEQKKRATTSSSLTATEIWDDSTPYNPTDSAIMIDTGTNNVGIGTSNPTSRLTIMSADSGNGNSDEFAFLSQYNTAEDRVGYVQKIGFYGKEEYSNSSRLAASIECLYGDNIHIADGYPGHSSSNLIFKTGDRNQGNATERMRINHDGNVGIGTSAPSWPLHIQKATAKSGNHGLSGGSIRSNWANASTNTFDDIYSNLDAISTISLYIEGGLVVKGGQAWVTSDERIKNNITILDDTKALDIINKIECKEYRYIDPFRRKSIKTIGFIAQEVNSVLPNAINILTDYLPDELRIIQNPLWSIDNSSNNILTINDLELSGNHTGNCRFYLSNDISGNDETMIDVMVEDDKKSFKFKKKYNNVFLWGKEVNDFHTLDKAQIFALHHSAIQELDRKHKREVESKEEKIASLESRVESLEAFLLTVLSKQEQIITKNTELENKIIEIESNSINDIESNSISEPENIINKIILL